MTCVFASLSIVDHHWAIIQKFACDVLNDYDRCKLKFQNKKQLESRFSFTRSVSRDLYDRHELKAKLRDEGTPICILHPDEVCESFHQATVSNNESSSKFNYAA